MNYADYLTRAARMFGSTVAVIDGERTVTYAEWEERARRLALGLRALGLRDGDRVADIGWNRLESLDLDFALARAHLIRVSINADLPFDAMATIIEDAGCRALVVGPDFDKTGQLLLDRCPDLRILIGPGEASPYPYEEMLNHSGEPDWQAPAADDILALRYTGGTTGPPKAVIRRHRDQVHVAAAILLDLFPITRDDRMLHATPLSHGANPYILPLVMRGAGQVIQRRFDAAEALRLVAAHRVTATKIVPPTMLVQLIQARRGSCADLDLSSLRQVIYGSAALPRPVLRAAAETFGPIFAQTYGLTEFPVGVCCLPRDLLRAGLEQDSPFLASAGRPYAFTDVAIQLDDGTTAGPADGDSPVGEVVVRGPLMTTGYWNRSDATSRLTEGGWLRTGDFGRFDRDGFLYLLGRAEDAIGNLRQAVFPREIEDVLYHHPGVAEAVVVELETGQLAAAVAPAARATVTPDDLLEHCARHLPPRKCPAVVRFFDDLPRSSSGKLLRGAARELFMRERAAGRGDSASRQS